MTERTSKATISKILELSRDGKQTYREIAQACFDMGFPGPRGKPVAPSTVSHILHGAGLGRFKRRGRRKSKIHHEMKPTVAASTPKRFDNKLEAVKNILNVKQLCA